MAHEFTPQSAAEITEEIIDAAYEIADGWYQSSPIDWDELLYRLDGLELEDGRVLFMPEQMTHPAITALQRAVRARRREAQG